jgi:MYXO-CTERM domain-containing protein
VAHGGGRFLVAWEDTAAGEMQAALIDETGALVLRPTLPDPPLGMSARSPAVAFDGATFIVFWNEGLFTPTQDLVAVEVSVDGVVSAPFDVTDSPPLAEDPLSAASNGLGRTLLAYESYDATIDYYTSGRRLAARVLDDPIPIPDAGIGPSDAGEGGADGGGGGGGVDSGGGGVDSGGGGVDSGGGGGGGDVDAGGAPIDGSSGGGCGCATSPRSPRSPLALLTLLALAALGLTLLGPVRRI